MSASVKSLLQFWQAGGILMPILAVVCFCILYLSLRLYIPLLKASSQINRFSPDCSCTYEIDINDYHISQLRPCEQLLKILRALVACSPLLGLLGTVKGMITTFIALGGRGVASMDMLSVGISEALITTQIGLIIAIPGLISVHASARLIGRIQNNLDRLEIHRAMQHRTETQSRLQERST